MLELTSPPASCSYPPASERTLKYAGFLSFFLKCSLSLESTSSASTTIKRQATQGLCFFFFLELTPWSSWIWRRWGWVKESGTDGTCVWGCCCDQMRSLTQSSQHIESAQLTSVSAFFFPEILYYIIQITEYIIYYMYYYIFYLYNMIYEMICLTSDYMTYMTCVMFDIIFIFYITHYNLYDVTYHKVWRMVTRTGERHLGTYWSLQVGLQLRWNVTFLSFPECRKGALFSSLGFFD